MSQQLPIRISSSESVICTVTCSLSDFYELPNLSSKVANFNIQQDLVISTGIDICFYIGLMSLLWL